MTVCRGIVGRPAGYIITSLLLAGIASGQLCENWVRTWGGAGHEWAYGLGIDGGGNLYLPGGTESFGAGGTDVLLLKYDSGGNFLWGRTWGGLDDDDIEGGVFQDGPGGGFILSGSTQGFGAFFGDALALKLDSAGNLAWARTWDSVGDDHTDASILDSAGDLYLAGGTTRWSPSFYDEVLLIKYDLSTGVPQNPAVVTWGAGSGDASINDGCAWTDSSSGTDYLYLAGYIQSPATSYDVLLQKYDTSLNLIWSRSWGGVGDDDAWGMTVDVAGNVYLVGVTSEYSAGLEDALLLKWDAQGNLLWGVAWGAAGNDGAGAVILDGGYVYLSSETKSFDPGFSDGLFLKFDPATQRFLWSKTWGAPQQFEFTGLVPWNGIFYGLGVAGPVPGFLRDCRGVTTQINPAVGVSSQTGPSIPRVGIERTPSGTVTNLVNGTGQGAETLLIEFSACGSDPPGVGYCFGDPGGGTPCPCSNDNDLSVPGSGCANGAFASGAQLTGSGEALVSADTLVLTTTGLHPNNTGLYFQANNAINGGHGNAFGDGLRCAGGGLIRLQVRTANGVGSSSTSVAVGVKGGVTAGDTKRYQCWYRDNSGSQPCGVGVNDFNLSNGYEIAWLP